MNVIDFQKYLRDKQDREIRNQFLQVKEKLACIGIVLSEKDEADLLDELRKMK